MRRLALIFSLLLAVTALHAMELYTHIDIQNTEVEKIYVPGDTIERVTFTDAIHLDNIPWYNTDITIGKFDRVADYTIELANIISEPCSEAEFALLGNLGTEPLVRKEITVTQGEKTLEIYILPFFTADGKACKISSFTLRVSKPDGRLKTEPEPQLPVQSYAQNSVLSSGSWYKVGVTASGLYRLTYSEIQKMGIGDPAGVRVYGYGGALIDEDLSKALPRPDDLPEVAVYMEKGSDGVFSEGDYILFYAQGPVKDEIDAESGAHSYSDNYCSRIGYYFITCGSGEGKRIQTSDAVTADATISYTKTYAGYYIQSPEFNLIQSGREWYGYKFSNSRLSQRFTISDTNIDTSESLLLEINVVGCSSSSTTFKCVVDGANAGKINIASSSAASQAGRKGSLKKYLDITSNANIPVDITYNPATSSDLGYIHNITANYFKQLILDSNNNSILITNPEDISEGEIAEYSVSGAGALTMVWDVTNHIEPHRIVTTLDGATLRFKEDHSTFHKFLAFNPIAALTPIMSGAVANQNIHALENPDMVIVSPAEYMAASERLAAFHRSYDGMTVHVFNPEAVYNEFSSGTPDVSAFRLMMKMFYDRSAVSGAKAPQSLLFMGTTNYDNRGVLGVKNPLVGYQSQESLSTTASYTTDDFYGMLDDGEGATVASATMDIGVGRLPVTSAQEAENVVNKTIEYVTSSSYGDWRSLCTFLADNGDQHTHERQADQLAAQLLSTNKSYKADKIFLDSYQAENTSSGNSFPGARNKVLENIKNGTILFTYVGHGSPNTLTTELTITKNDIYAMYNKNLALWATATCDFARYDDNSHSAGMEVLLNARGGGIGLYTTTRVVYSSENFKLMQAVYKTLIPNEGEATKTIGEIFRLAKVALKNNSNKLNFTLLGDPAIKLHYPTHRVITDRINGKNPNEATMPALGIVTIEGHVEDIDGNLLDTYNGKVEITVYDKEEEISTIGQEDGSKFQYTDYPNKIFRGTVTVTNGVFTNTFMVPKDINYRLGFGKILYYAYQESDANNDAFGNNVDFTVGASDPRTDEETTDGPVVKMYMNSPEFVNGGKVNDSPVLYAHLYDQYGINVVGAGIGHDVTAILSGQNSGSYVLNDYYTSTLNDYKSGVVKYQFHNLDAGRYNLDFKAWNLQNVSTSASLSFVVDNKERPGIEEFYMYPNPATDHTTIYLRHNRPEVPVSVTFIVYDVAWNECWSTTVTENTDGTFIANWDLSGKFGNMSSGVYCVRAKISMADGSYTHKVEKIIVKTQ